MPTPQVTDPPWVQLLRTALQQKHPAASDTHPLHLPTRYGVVRMGQVRVCTINGVGCVEVHLADNPAGPPDYRIFNPPVNVQGPGGLVTDPVMALAEAIALHRRGPSGGGK